MFSLEKNRILCIRLLDASDCIITVLIPFLAIAYILEKKPDIYFKMLSDGQHGTDHSTLLSLVIKFLEKNEMKILSLSSIQPHGFFQCWAAVSHCQICVPLAGI